MSFGYLLGGNNDPGEPFIRAVMGLYDNLVLTSWTKIGILAQGSAIKGSPGSILISSNPPMAHQSRAVYAVTCFSYDYIRVIPFRMITFTLFFATLLEI